MRAGRADDRFNVIEYHAGTGVVIAAPFRTLGIASGMAVVGDPYRRFLEMSGEQTRRSETRIELTYRHQLTDWLSLQPDLRYVIDRSVLAHRDASVVGMRIELGF